MAYSTRVLKEMIIKSTVFLILIYSIVIQGAHGYLGCADPLVPCLNKTHCINIEQICVDYHDCDDGIGGKLSCHYCEKDASESIACVTHVDHGIVFECLSPNQICDNEKNCINNEDEDSCGITKCKHGFWPCGNGTCIDKTHICDSNKDCPDGRDEGEFCHEMLCGEKKFHCPTGECISKEKVCDKVPHCSNGFDEQNCSHWISTLLPVYKVNDSCSISSNKFTCSTSGTSIHPICISADRVCDGYKDCPTGDDEHDCTEQCDATSTCITNSNVTCFQNPAVGQLCRCVKPGYRLTTDLTQNNIHVCQDFDECNDSLRTYCSFKCFNTDGSFNCTCPLGFVIDKETKTCRRITDVSKPNLLVVFDDNIILFNIWNNINRYSSKPLSRINIEKTHHFDRIQYDHNRMFVIYYDHIHHAVLCKPNTNLKTLVLISNVTVNGFAYNANEKTLFIFESSTQTLRLYTPIICDLSYHIRMHSWSFNQMSNPIHSMEIDIYNRQLIFASNYQFMISNISEPNVTKVVYTTDRPIQRFIYDASFQRIFWTALNITHDEFFPVYTCDGGFRRCHDTSVRLPLSWPFAFFDDGLIYSPISLKSLEIAPLYRKHLSSNGFITSTQENIHSLLVINHPEGELSNLCGDFQAISCKEKLCLQINSTDISCLSTDDIITPKGLSALSINPTNSILQNAVQSLLDDGLISHSANHGKKHGYTPTSTILFCIIIMGILAVVVAFFVKRCHKRLNQKAFDINHHQHEQCLASDEPNLDEFTIIADDRVSKRHSDYARDILFENPSLLLAGHRRDSV